MDMFEKFKNKFISNKKLMGNFPSQNETNGGNKNIVYPNQQRDPVDNTNVLINSYKKEFESSEPKKTFNGEQQDAGEGMHAGKINEIKPNTNPEKFPGYVTVYHVINPSDLEKVRASGLSPERAVGKEKRSAFDEIFDKFAPPGFSRSSAIYAHPTEDLAKKDVNLTLLGRPKLEIKVDPKKVLVADGEFFSKATAYARNLNPEMYSEDSLREAIAEETEFWAKEYWKKAISLEEYLEKKGKGQEPNFSYPEVIIPYAVKPEYIE